MRRFFITAFLFSLFPLLLNAQEDVIRLQVRSKTLLTRPDINGNVLALDENGVKRAVSITELEQFVQSAGSAFVSDEPLDMTMFPGFPVGITNTGYNSGHEGILFCNMDADPQLEIVMNLSQATHAINIDGSSVSGWPKTISQGLAGGPVYGDIDGDGEDEIVAGSYSGSTTGYIYAYEKNGTPVTGFPVNTGYIWRSPALSDLNNDGAMEIIAAKRQYPTGQVIVLKGDGTPLTGWPQNVATVPGSSPAVGDITGDNNPEIIFEALNSIYAFDAAGNILPGFPYNYPTDAISSYSSPVLADVNNDALREIIFGLHESSGALRGLVIILKNDGSVYPGWPKYTNYWVYAPPSVGHINNDNVLDVAVGDQILSGTPVDNLYAWDINGNLLTGFPVTPVDAINAHTIIVDIDGDSFMELIFDNNTSAGGQGKYHAVNHDGSVVTGWPITTQGGTFFITPSITDINFDNIMDMIGAGSSGSAPNATTYISLWNAGVPYSAAAVSLPMFMYNIYHNGIKDQPTIIPVEMESFTADVNFNDVNLIWVTVTETNNAGFKLYRNDELIGFIEGKGTVTEKQVYKYSDKNLKNGTYVYRLAQVDYNGTVSFAGSVTIEMNDVPSSYSLNQNYPNPFNPSTSIKYQVAENTNVLLAVYDVLGNEVTRIVNEYKNAGSYEISFDASSLTSGVYFYSLTTDNFFSVKKMILMR